MARVFSEEHKRKISESLKGRKLSKEHRDKIRKSRKTGSDHHKWKGGITKKNLPFYDTYAPQLGYVDKVRKSKKNENILEVKCAYCGKWYIPKMKDVQHRILSINGKTTGERRLYCSISCKNECPIYNQNKYPKGYKKTSSREVQPELRQLVFERDNWTCRKCGNKKSLHCHHIEGIRWIPLESADIDKCITYCKTCHIEVHKIDECGYQDMQCKEALNG